MSTKHDAGTDGGTNQHKPIHTCDHMSHIWISLCLNEEFAHYLIIQDEDTEVHHSLSYRNGDVTSLWTEVLNGRVGTFRYLNNEVTMMFIPAHVLIYH